MSATVVWAFAASGTAAFMIAFGLTLVSTSSAVLAALGVFQLGFLPPMVITSAAMWATAAVIIVIGVRWIAPVFVRYLGERTRQTMPRRIRRKWRLKSLKNHCQTLRITILVLALLPLITLLGQSIVRWCGEPWTTPELPVWGLFAAVMVLSLAALVRLQFVPAYRNVRAREIRRGLRYHRRGVSLRSFIPQFDSSNRPIYRTCRMSRRLANAHRSMICVTAAIVSLAGCLAALLRGPNFIPEIAVLVSVGCLLALIPSKHQIVKFSGAVIDPFCRTDEWEIFE